MNHEPGLCTDHVLIGSPEELRRREPQSGP